MLDQPLIGAPNQSQKACWGCATTTPYNQGFCAECWAEIPPDMQQVYVTGAVATEPWGGQVRMAIASGLKLSKIPKRVIGDWNEHYRKQRKIVTPLTLEELFG